MTGSDRDYCETEDWYLYTLKRRRKNLVRVSKSRTEIKIPRETINKNLY